MYLIKVKVKDSCIHGKGYFADQFVPVGTIIYCYSTKDLKVTNDQFNKLPKDKRDHIAECAVEDEFGNWVETEKGPYTNHSCDPNIMQIYVQGRYLDIAIRDINVGDEVTLDYGLFYSSEKWMMNCNCGAATCRKIVGFGVAIGCEIEEEYFEKTMSAVSKISDVEQPIFNVTDEDVVNTANLLKNVKNTTLAKFNKFSIING